MDKITKRDDRLAFMGIGASKSEFSRLRGFTEFSLSKNPVEYQRRYIDEKNERNDVVGFSPSIGYSFDRFVGDGVHDDFVNITDNELTGDEAVRSFLIVDLTADGDNKKAYMRDWTIIPDSEGDSVDAYTYSGTLKANGKMISGTATSTDNWQTCQFVADE